MAIKDLPTYYYHSHFCEFLEFVKGPCNTLLNNQHLDFLQTFEQLSFHQQCALVRVINRKYQFIQTASLTFAELPNIADLLDELGALGLVRVVSSDDIPALLNLLTKPDLQQLVSEFSPTRIPKSANKQRFLDECHTLNAETLVNSNVFDQFLVRTTDSCIEYFLFLYFGHNRGRLNQFSMRDLGLMTTRDEQAQMCSRFVHYEHAYSQFLLLQAKSQFKSLSLNCAESIQGFIKKLPEAHGSQALQTKEALVFELNKALFNFDPDQALTQMEVLDYPKAQEFWCRKAYLQGAKEQVRTRLFKIIDDPSSDKLLQFAEDFLARKYKQKRTSVLTDKLRNNNRHLHLDENYKGAVEQGAIAYYQARGISAWRTENFLWQNLFGLCFWQELFELEGLGLATPFDYLPICIKHHEFYHVAHQQIDERLACIQQSKDLTALLIKNAAKYFGKKQGIVHWHPNIVENLQVLVKHAPLEGLKMQLLQMCKNWQLYHDGYPDIMVLEGNQLRFEEIKAQGDSLRRNQLMQMQSLERAGIKVDITTVDWSVDPMQPYAVVDIETTGGRAGLHKITEIGVVKMVNGEVVEQWQSLINPQRRIPSNITALTGISNDMVSNAPLFVDVADEFDAFTKDCIFVAHNVNFDYGFIREEYAQIGRHFRRPKLCTVVQMRKYYKGLASYSLANLTRHFDISMQRHHRALSDAIAASELLKLVNCSRTQEQSVTQ